MEEDFKEAKASPEENDDGGKLTPEEEKFLAMLDEDRPAPLEDIDSSDDRENNSAEPPEPPRRMFLRILLYTLFVAAVILGVYFFFPKQHKAKPTIEQCRSIDELPPEMFADERYGSIMKKALEAYFKGDFTRCVETLHPYVNTIIKERHTSDVASDALSLYVHTLRFASLRPPARREAIETLAALAREEPDNAAWRLAIVRICHGEVLDYQGIFERSKTHLPEWRGLLARCNDVLAECRSLEQTQRQKIAAADDDHRPRLRGELAEILALQCSIYTSKWILEGGEGKASLPDDDGDRGVASREHAVRLAMDKDPDCGRFKASTPEFYEARHFIAMTVKSQASGLFNSYFWNGARHARITPLQKEINNTSAKLRKLRNH